MEGSKRATRRRHSQALKARVLSECAEPGASVANVALAHGLNANLVHKWRRQTGGVEVTATSPCEVAAFVPLPLAAHTAPAAGNIRIELRRGAMAVNVTWPIGAAGECVGWLRELLK
jgi:transposase